MGGAEEVKPAEAPVESCATQACCDEPKAAPIPIPQVSAGAATAAGAGDAEDAAGKQTRAQKKMMKAMSKLNLKHVPGIMKVVMRRKGNILFSIHGGEVYKAPGSDTYIVFGEAQPPRRATRTSILRVSRRRTSNSSCNRLALPAE